MVINDAGRKIIMQFEGCSLEAYLCPAGIWTIGYGHTGDVSKGDKINQHQAEVILEYDLQRFEEAVGQLCPKANANEFSALVCLCFNIGPKALETSTLRKKFLAGARLSAANEFVRFDPDGTPHGWIHGGKNPDGTPRVLPGLVKRRAAEKALFLEVPS